MSHPPGTNHPSSHGKNAKELQLELDEARRDFPEGTLYVIPRSARISHDVVGELHHVFRAGDLELCAGLIVRKGQNASWWNLQTSDYYEPRVPVTLLFKLPL